MYELNLSTKMYLGGWDLNGDYKQLIRMRGENLTGNEVSFNSLDESVQHASDLMVDEAQKIRMVGPNGQTKGCLQKYPLRYGDVDGDGKQELVLNVGFDWVIFSPTIHKVTFVGLWEKEDYMDEERIQWFEWTHDQPADPQYVAESSSNPDVNHVVPARRAYAKFYLGDFDTNGKPDILMWRKAYQSRLNSDPVKGYQLIGQALVHYEEENGVYTKKDTTEDVIKSWLTAKNLTWQKGYPNVSECPGEEGKPIPETVDPLLNDPDVLQ